MPFRPITQIVSLFVERFFALGYIDVGTFLAQVEILFPF